MEEQNKEQKETTQGAQKIKGRKLRYLLIFLLGIAVGFIGTHLAENYANRPDYLCGTPDINIEYPQADKPVINAYDYTEPVEQYEEKPVINAYDYENAIEGNIKVEFTDGKFTCTYPKYNKDTGWNIKVPKTTDKEAGGLIVNLENDREYNYLYWEGESDLDYNTESGFCIKSEDTADFLYDALKELGLNNREANEFIVYWLPKMEQNKYNYITFLDREYTDKVKLNVTPEPDNMLRIYMVFKGLEEEIEVREQSLSELRGDFKREGFTIVEWGGSESNKNILK